MLIGKFTHVLSGNFQFRESEKKYRTDEDYEILSVIISDPTEFGQQGSVKLWVGRESEVDWEHYDSDTSWMSVYFFGFQNFIEFYTTPTKFSNTRKLVLYTPRNDWTGWESVVIDEIEYKGDISSDDDEEKYFEELLVRFIGNKYQLKKVSDEYLSKYINEP
jgi:hypothetical protein